MKESNPPKSPSVLELRRKGLLNELSSLDQMRRGSITEQCFTSKRKDGSTIRCGPYPLFTRKVGKKTVSQRLSDPGLLPVYRLQVANMRRFEFIMTQLVEIGEQLSDLAIREESEKKTRGGTGAIRRSPSHRRRPGATGD